MKPTGQLEIDTPLLASVCAEAVTNDPEQARALANRARRHYAWMHNHNRQSGFYRMMRGADCRRWLLTFMLQWLDAMREHPEHYKQQNPADFV